MSETAATARTAGSTGAASTSWPTRPSSGRLLAAASSRRASSELLDPVSRRTFAKLMGASLALAGVTACTRQPAETIVPYVRQPEEIVPGKPLYFATAMPMAGYARRCSSRATRAARRRSKATRTTRSTAGRPTSSRRPRFSASTTPTGRRRSPTAATSGRGATFARRSGGASTPRALAAARHPAADGQRHLADARGPESAGCRPSCPR